MKGGKPSKPLHVPANWRSGHGRWFESAMDMMASLNLAASTHERSTKKCIKSGDSLVRVSACRHTHIHTSCEGQRWECNQAISVSAMCLPVADRGGCAPSDAAVLVCLPIQLFDLLAIPLTICKEKFAILHRH